LPLQFGVVQGCKAVALWREPGSGVKLAAFVQRVEVEELGEVVLVGRVAAFESRPLEGRRFPGGWRKLKRSNATFGCSTTTSRWRFTRPQT